MFSFSVGDALTYLSTFKFLTLCGFILLVTRGIIYYTMILSRFISPVSPMPLHGCVCKYISSSMV
jgi:hypothetical protein